ncbi:DUF2515 family protein [Pseudomonas sp. NPDC096917]|uniref:DUF2515 family protein n=1 Tax=Pseudomonas sp. NPDC096917 TaxID=3364483 RepID=UPI00383B8513
MTQCFKDQTCDTQLLNQNTIPLSECKTRFVEVYGCMTEVTDVPILTCEGIWRIFQREAEEIVAPGGTLIADPIARNRAINAAYARLWLHDERFQWAGLAAFASKQVGCGLLHASESIGKIEDEFTARKKWLAVRSKGSHFELPGDEENQLRDAYDEASDKNLMPVDLRLGEPQTIAQKQFQYVYDMMALGNTTLFLDIFPLHAFYKKRGLEELKTCLSKRANIFGHLKFPVLWPVGQDKLRFGRKYNEILQAFTAIETGDISKSVEFFAFHEQRNILQPSIYGDTQLVRLLRGNHASYVTGFPSGVAQAIELTLSSQCQRVDDDRTISFDDSPFANLADVQQRMTFVLEAAKRFDEMLHDSNRKALVQSINEIAAVVVAP